MYYIVVIAVFAIGRGSWAQTSQDQSSETSLSTANNEFAFKIFRLLSKDGENSVLSPLSINIVFSILMNGAQSQTLDDMRRFLEYDNKLKNVSESIINEGFETIMKKYFEISQRPENDDPVKRWDSSHPAKLYINNRLVKSDKFQILPTFENAVKKHFSADLQSADFENNNEEETKKVNDWVSNATNHKITNLFDKIPIDTSLAIINAIHFKGQWNIPFPERLTNKTDFYNNGETSVKTETMHNSKEYKYLDSEELESQLLEMTYLDEYSQISNFSFVVVLPKQKNGLKALKETMNSRNLKTALDSMYSQRLSLDLPKFKVESEYDLMNDISPKPHFLTLAAKFSRLSSEPTFVSKAKHKVYIDVNEKATEAAAATFSINVSRKGVVGVPIEFKADHPFLYFIRDRSNDLILFMGQINKL